MDKIDAKGPLHFKFEGSLDIDLSDSVGEKLLNCKIKCILLWMNNIVFTFDISILFPLNADIQLIPESIAFSFLFFRIHNPV